MRVMLLAVLVVLGLLGRGTAARADVPAYLPVEGELADSHGNALDGQVAIRFRLYDHAEPEGDDEAILYEEDVPLVSVVDGHFTVYLGFYEKLDLALFQDQRLYLGLLVSGDSEELAPRPALDTVPFAIGAQFCADAERLEGLGADAFMPSSYAPAWGDITGIPSVFAPAPHRHAFTDLDGVPADLSDGDDDHGITAIESDGWLATSIEGRTARISPAFGSCQVGSAIRAIHADGTVECEVDDNVDPEQLDASHIVRGTLSTDRYSAADDLRAEQLLDADADAALLRRAQADLRYVNLAACTWSVRSCGASDVNCDVACPQGNVVVSGGCDLTSGSSPGLLVENFPTPNAPYPPGNVYPSSLMAGWHCRANATGKVQGTYALCCPLQ